MFDASPAPAGPAPVERYFPETGIRLSGPFLAFYEHYGPALCGPPVSPLLEEDGVPTQYFRNLVLQERLPGRITPRPLGAEAHERRQAAPGGAESSQALNVVDLRGRLSRDPEQGYPRRPLADIRYLVLHHTGAPASVGPEAIAAEHVDRNGWPGIGYHYIVDVDGTVYHCQDLGFVSHHAAQFNPVSVGIALAGNLRAERPGRAQLQATSELLAELCRDLGLPPGALRGHGELVATECPGSRFLTEWKGDLLTLLERRLRRSDADRTSLASQSGATAAAEGTI